MEHSGLVDACTNERDIRSVANAAANIKNKNWSYAE